MSLRFLCGIPRTPLGLVALLGLVPSATFANPVVSQGVLDALAEKPTVRVMIAFDLAAASAELEGGAFLTSEAGQQAVASARERVLAAISAGELALQRQFTSVPAVAGDITRRGLEELLLEPSVRRVDLDVGGGGNLSESIPLSSFDTVQMAGLTGTGTTVAVIDSGYDTDHADLSDNLVAEQCFCSDNGAGCCPGGGITQSGVGSAEDDHGHGTNVSGVITSAGNVASIGAAPDAGIVAVKVLDDNNSFCCTSDVVAGLDWVATNFPDVEAVNASLGTFALFPGECDDATAFTMALATAVDNLRSLGVPVFVSAGNEGSGTEMGAPACVANSISVGAVYDSNFGPNTVFCSDPTTAADQVTCFSNSNATTDLFAPGAPITSAGVGGGTSTFFGTSQASPHAAACAALLRQATPTLTPEELETALESSPIMVTDSTNGLSFPRLDCQNALDLTSGLIFADSFESGDASAW
ncbi:MAG: S8 family serine peptidase [Acidobacteriota bacterium]